MKAETRTQTGIPIQIVRSRRRVKSISIQVLPDGVRVRVPFKTSQEDIDELLNTRHDWITKHWNQLQQRQRPIEPPTPAAVQAIAASKSLARAEIPKRVGEWAERLGLSYGSVRIKDQKTRWGSCSKVGNLNFNWRLIHAPTYVLDYVIVHELCHLRELNHSRRFWRLVATAYPRFEEAKAWLRTNGSTLFELPQSPAFTGCTPSVHDRMEDVSKA